MKQNSGINSAGNEKTEKLTSEPKKDIVSDGTEQMQGNADKNESAAFDGEARIEAAGTLPRTVSTCGILIMNWSIRRKKPFLSSAIFRGNWTFGRETS